MLTCSLSEWFQCAANTLRGLTACSVYNFMLEKQQNKQTKFPYECNKLLWQRKSLKLYLKIRVRFFMTKYLYT